MNKELEEMFRNPCEICSRWFECEIEQIEKRECEQFDFSEIECNIDCTECAYFQLALCTKYNALHVAEKLKKIYLLNSPVITSEGNYSYRKIDESEAKDIIEIVQENRGEIVSAIGHESTAQLLSQILNYNVQVNRISICMNQGEGGIVFRVIGRLPEGKVLSEEELKNIKFELGFLFKF